MSRTPDYGGAFDIAPDQYFTKDELNELSSSVVDILSAQKDYKNVRITDAHILTGNVISISCDLYYNPVEMEIYELKAEKKIDLRKLSSPNKLSDVYAPVIAETIAQEARKSLDIFGL